MEWPGKIRICVGSYILRQQLKKRKRNPAVCNLAEAKKIGIIYNATELAGFEIIRDLAKRISDHDVTVSILGYVHSKNLVDQYLYRKDFDFFHKGNLNWYDKPCSEITDKFMNEPFDILINLSLEDYYPIQYITALSPARFKAGRYSSEDTALDLMIDIEKEKARMKKLQSEISSGQMQKSNDRKPDPGMTKRTDTELQLNFLINQLMHYLMIINKNNP
ncbi:MAG: hypothetical protein JXB19_00650 [Bacteroidales bacterium]|nr:hypothetical protein [Bacteroidales bacterium]